MDNQPTRKTTNTDLIKDIKETISTLMKDTTTIKDDISYIKQQLKEKEEARKGWFY